MALTALLIGLVGSLHCVGMCGPIALALPSRQQLSQNLLISRLLYNAGRVLTYAMLGLVVGLIGQGFSMAGFQQIVSIGAGVAILIMVLLPARINQRISLLRPAVEFTAYLKRAFGDLFRSKSWYSTFCIGLINGFLPCGLVYAALAGALATGSYLNGTLYMLLFGIGTIPMMLAVSLAGNYINLGLRRWFSRAVPVFMVALAIVFILRGLNLGIPYLSPRVHSSSQIENQTLCH
jgi:uncharacterized protein